MRRLLLATTLAALTLVACGSPTDGGGGDTAGTPAAAESDLVVEFDPGDGSSTERYTLTCGEVVEGDHPDAAETCEHLAAMDDPFAPVADDAICTEQYGGPQTAHVTGMWKGDPVDLELSRENGCHISQWDALGPLLPGPVG